MRLIPGLAQIVRTGWYREVAVKSEHRHRVRGLLAVRAKLVGMRKEVANQLRGLLKVFGHVIGAAGGEKFDARARELAGDDTTLSVTAEALLATRAALAAQVAKLDKLLLDQARQDPACQRLMTVPGHRRDSFIVPTFSRVRRRSVTRFIPVAVKASLLWGATAMAMMSP